MSDRERREPTGPVVLNFYHVGKTVPSGAVYIGRGRGSTWGNPFEIGKHGDRDEVVARHREWFLSQPALIERARRELRGRNLVCFCKPKSCHGDVLVEVANSDDA